MQQQIRTQTPKKNKPAASLIISWLIILGVYLLLRLVFVIFGFHLAPVILGGCLAVLPYIAGAFYLFKTPAAHRVGGCVLGILLPSIVEKLVLYFLGASLYGIPLADVSGVMSRIAANEPFTHIFSNPAARYILNLSFFGWQYIVGSKIVSSISSGSTPNSAAIIPCRTFAFCISSLKQKSTVGSIIKSSLFCVSCVIVFFCSFIMSPFPSYRTKNTETFFL